MPFLPPNQQHQSTEGSKKGKGSPYSITERRVPELIPVLGSQPAGDVSHKPGCRQCSRVRIFRFFSDFKKT